MSASVRLFGDQRTLWMTVMVHITGSQSQLRPLHATMRRGSRALLQAPVFFEVVRLVRSGDHGGRSDGGFVTPPDGASRIEASQATSDAY